MGLSVFFEEHIYEAAVISVKIHICRKSIFASRGYLPVDGTVPVSFGVIGKKASFEIIIKKGLCISVAAESFRDEFKVSIKCVTSIHFFDKICYCGCQSAFAVIESHDIIGTWYDS